MGPQQPRLALTHLVAVAVVVAGVGTGTKAAALAVALAVGGLQAGWRLRLCICSD